MEEKDSNDLLEFLLRNEVAVEDADLKAAMKQERRQRITNKILEALKKRIPFSGPEGLQELGEIAVRFEEKMYAEAASQSDYLKKIALKMLKLEEYSKTRMAHSLNSNGASNSKNSEDPASQSMQSQNIQNNISSTVVPNFTGSTPVPPPMNGKSEGTVPSGNVPVQNPDVQNMFNATPFAPMMQGWPTDSVSPFGQSQIQAGQQQITSQSFMQSQQQKMNLQRLMHQRLQLLKQANTLPNSVVSDQSQVQQQLLPENIQNNNASNVVLNSAALTPSTTQSHVQPQQSQNLLQPNQPMPQPLMSLNQPQPGKLQPQLYLQKRCKSRTGLVLQQQTPIDQQKQSFQSQSARVTALKKTQAMKQPQMPSRVDQVNSQTQSMNIKSSTVMPTQQHNTLSSDSSCPNSRPNMLGELQSGSNIDPGQSNVLNQKQQVATNSLKQNLVGGSQSLTGSMSSQNGLTALQSNASSLQSNSNAVQPQQIYPLQHTSVSQQLMLQQYQQAQMLHQQHMQKLLQHQQQHDHQHQIARQLFQQQQLQLMHHLVQQQQHQQQTLQKQSVQQLIQQQQQQQQTLQKQTMQQLIQQQQQQQQTLQKQSVQQLIQQQQQTSQKQSEQQLIQKQPPAPQQQQQTSQKQSAQHVIQMQEETSQKPFRQRMTRITAFLKLVCRVLIFVLLIRLMIEILMHDNVTGRKLDA